MIKLERDKIISISFFLLVAIFAFWQISFLVYSLRGDIIDGILPRYTFISQVFKSGEFPFWNPYQTLGYPIYASFIVSIWDPITVFIASTIGFNLYVFHFLFIGLVALAGLGFSRLLCKFGIDVEIANTMGVCYMLSGVFVANTMHLRVIMAAAWLPWFFIYFLALFESQKGIKNILRFSVVASIFLLQSYQKLILFTGYFSFLYVFFLFYKLLQQKKTKEVGAILIRFLCVFLLIGVLISPAIISSVEVFSQMDRGDKMSYELSQLGAFLPKATISFLLPVAVTSKEILGNEAYLTLNNAFFGVIPLVFFLCGIFIKKVREKYSLLLLLTVFCFLLSMGKHFLFSRYVYDFIPLSGNFKIPSLFRLFGIAGALIFSAKSFHFVFKNHFLYKKIVVFIACFLLILLLYFLLFSVIKSLGAETVSLYSFIINYTSQSVWYKLIIQGVVQIIVLCFFLYYYFQLNKKGILFLMVFEMVFATSMNTTATSVINTTSPFEVQSALNKYPNDFPLPKNYLMNSSLDQIDVPLVWRNGSVFSKNVAYDGYNAFKLKNYNKIINCEKGLFLAIKKNPLVYFSEEIYPWSFFTALDTVNEIDRKKLFFAEEEYNELKNFTLKTTKGDTTFIKQFKTNNVRIETRSKKQQMLTLLQVNYKGWKAFVDGKETKIYSSNNGFRSIVVPKGVHMVLFKYSNWSVLISFFVSMFSFLFILGYLVIKQD